jgi:cytochrome P450
MATGREHDREARRGPTGGKTVRPDGPGGLPLLGNTTQFASDPFAFYEACPDYGDVVPYTVGGETFYMVMHPDDIERVLATEHAKFRKGDFQRDQLGFVLGRGLLTSEGERWRRQRQQIQPAFSPERIQSYTETMTDCAGAAADGWRAGEQVAVDEEMRRVTVQVLARSLFGTDITAHVETIAEAMDDIGARADGSLLVALVPPWVPTPWNRRAERGAEAIDGIIEELVAERRGEADEHDDLLSWLLEATEAGDLDPDTLRDQLVTFLLAGHETTSLALTYTWYLLADHPEKRERLHGELDAELDGAPTMADLPALEYTEQVIRESMRVYPPVYRILRETGEPVDIGGYAFEEGTKLTLPQWNVHRDPRWWDDPEQFRPERWAGEADRPEYAYFPFGGGPRRCIGMRFALIEAQLILATIARHHELDLAGEDDLDLQPGVTMAPADPVRMTVRER